MGRAWASPSMCLGGQSGSQAPSAQNSALRERNMVVGALSVLSSLGAKQWGLCGHQGPASQLGATAPPASGLLGVLELRGAERTFPFLPPCGNGGEPRPRCSWGAGSRALGPGLPGQCCSWHPVPPSRDSATSARRVVRMPLQDQNHPGPCGWRPAPSMTERAQSEGRVIQTFLQVISYCWKAGRILKTRN